MQASDGASAAVPAELLSAGRDVRTLGRELVDLARALGPVASAGGCSGAAQGALAGLVGAARPALLRMSERTGELALSVEAAAAEFQRADGQ